MQNTKNVKVSYSLTTPLFLIFLILKLTGVINWSWWWVTSPLWIPLALFFIFAGIFALVLFILSKQ